MQYTKEQKQIARTMITEMVGLMLKDRITLKWTGTKTELIEMLHIAFVQQTLRNDRGEMAQFAYIIRKVFTRQAMSVPANTCKYITRTNQKKGVKSLPLIERFMYFLFSDDQMAYKGALAPPAGVTEKIMMMMGLF